MKEVINSLGRRKEAVARVFLTPGTGNIEANGLTLDAYFPTEAQRITIRKIFDLAELLRKYDIRANIKGGGKSGQAGALRLGLARAAVKVDPSIKKSLKVAGVLTRDSRMKERKKYGQKKARKKFQYSKR
ncbi:MAG: 30S ribosomal protein S9 [Candidatus Omnitrophica bacterium]|nr:30S ribosomal protein S9 [Candidatus Omnitrophota bacterium]MBU4488929.1 30S ribosomal protein S9 [Candidatus Omnitrophota bacterium]MCG2705325.1 30S ribosomal protein S9 [Candidatus Omnitrophota bacterium]